MNPRRMVLSENSKFPTRSVRGSSPPYDAPYMACWFGVVLYGCPEPAGTCPYDGALGGGTTKPGVAVYGGG